MPEHFSISQLEMFCRCGEQYRRRYLDGEIIPPAISAHIGTGVHKAAETNYRAKITTGDDLPLDAVCDCAADAYDRALREGVYFAPDEVSGARIAMAQGKDSAVRLAKLYRVELAPGIEPMLVEEKIYLDLPGVPLPLVTVLDLYTKDGALRDLKTASKKWPDNKANGSSQPTAYREAVKLATGAYPQKICFDVLVKSKEPCLQTVETARNDEDTAILARKFQIMAKSIEAGVFIPADPDSWICGPKFCGYYYTCPHIPAHRKILPKRSN